MLDDDNTNSTDTATSSTDPGPADAGATEVGATEPPTAPAKKATARKTAAKKTPAAKKAPAAKRTAAKKTAAADPAPVQELAGTDAVKAQAPSPEGVSEAPVKKAAARKTTTRKTAAKKVTAKDSTSDSTSDPIGDSTGDSAQDQAEVPAKAVTKAPVRKRAVKKMVAESPAPDQPAPDQQAQESSTAATETPTEESAAAPTAMLFQAPAPTKTARRTRRVPVTVTTPAATNDESHAPESGEGSADAGETAEPAVKKPAARKPAARSTKKTAAAAPDKTSDQGADQSVGIGDAAESTDTTGGTPAETPAESTEGSQPRKSTRRRGGSGRSSRSASSDDAASTPHENAADETDKAATGEPAGDQSGVDQSGVDQSGDDQSGVDGDDSTDATGDSDDDSGDSAGGPRRRRRRGGRRRRKGSDNDSGDNDSDDSETDSNDDGPSDISSADDANDSGSGDDSDDSDDNDDNSENGAGGTRRRRRRRRAGDSGGGASDDPENTVTRVRQGRTGEDQITAVTGSTRLEAKKQRRREGREAGRRRAPIVSEAEFLARRESVERVMVIRQRPDLTQIAVLEDKVLVEHYVARESQTSLIGNVYVARVQNVLPSMEAAFVDIGKGRNAVIYAGEINWAALGHKDGQPRKIESVLSSGQSILVQVTKDPIGHKGARLTGQVSLAGRFLVYVPDGTTSGISRKLPDTERSRLKTLLKDIVPDTAGVIVRTAAEGASEEELTQDVERLKARWEDIEAKTKSGNSPKLLYGEPDLTLKVVRDLFTEDFSKLVIEGDDAWETVQDYVADVAPDLEQRLERYQSANGQDSFAAYRVEEQIAKGLDRKVWLPSGGSLIVDRTEAMTVVDVNTGKFTGSGGNLEETVTKNNLEAAEEMVRQLRLRDIGGIIVVDFIDMVLESNRDLVLRRLVECLGRDRTRHQVAEVTSLGLVQMTRKRIGTGLLEAFSEDCEHCQGRGVIVHETPVEPKQGDDDRGRSGGRRTRGRGKGDDNSSNNGGSNNGGNNSGNSGRQSPPAPPSPKDVAAVAKAENADRPPADQSEPVTAEVAPTENGLPEAAEETTTQPAVVTSSRRQSGRRQGGRSGRTPAAENAEPTSSDASVSDTSKDEESVDRSGGTSEPVAPKSPTTSTDQAPAASPVQDPAPVSDQAAKGEAPKVVTRTRRRASRPAGVHTTPVVESMTVTPTTPAAEPAAAEPAAAPKVVTRVRARRGATRAAATTAGETAATTDAASSDTDDA